MGVDWDRMADRLLPGSLGGRKDAEKGKSVAWGPDGGLGLFWLRGTASPLNSSHLEA